MTSSFFVTNWFVVRLQKYDLLLKQFLDIFYAKTYMLIHREI